MPVDVSWAADRLGRDQEAGETRDQILRRFKRKELTDEEEVSERWWCPRPPGIRLTNLVCLGLNSISLFLLLSRQIDLQNLKLLYKEKIGKSLAEMVKSDTSSDYRSLLLTLLGDQ